MSGLKYLLDTNFVIGLLQGNPVVKKLVETKKVKLTECAFNFITRMELFGYPGIIAKEKQQIQDLLDDMTKLEWSHLTEEQTIALKQKNKLKLPDAMILATAQVHQLELLTLDQQLKKLL